MTVNQHEFLQAFLSTTLTKAQWTHEAHLRLGWMFVRLYGSWEAALLHVRQGIQALNEAINQGVGYNETITVFYLQLVDSRIRAGLPQDDWEMFQLNNQDLLDKAHRIIFEYYSPDILFSKEAAMQRVEPDRQPLP